MEKRKYPTMTSNTRMVNTRYPIDIYEDLRCVAQMEGKTLTQLCIEAAEMLIADRRNRDVLDAARKGGAWD